jgi:hypothetical protein
MVSNRTTCHQICAVGGTRTLEGSVAVSVEETLEAFLYCTSQICGTSYASITASFS